MKNILINTDPGIDDIITLMLAHACSDVSIAGIVTTYGNSTTAQCTYNAVSLLDFIGLTDIPVFQGRDSKQSNFAGQEVNGTAGLGRATLPTPRERILFEISDVPASISEQSDICFLSIACLSNVSDLLEVNPEFIKSLSEVVIMGGAVRTSGNNYNGNAECNIFNDVPAAGRVFNVGLMPLPKLIPLDVTRQALFTQKHLDYLRSCRPGHKLVSFLEDLMADVLIERPYSKGLKSFPLHDPLSLIACLHPDIFEFEELKIQVELVNEENYGRTFICEGTPNMKVATGFKYKDFEEFILNNLKALIKNRDYP